MSNQQVMTGLTLVALLAGAAWVIVDASAMPEAAAGFPIAMAIAVALFSVGALVQVAAGSGSAPGSSATPEDAGASGPSSASIVLRGLAFVVLAVGFVFLLDRIGFEPAAAILIAASMCVLDLREARRFWWIAVVLPPVLGLLFRTGLQLRLPLPQWPF